MLDLLIFDASSLVADWQSASHDGSLVALSLAVAFTSSCAAFYIAQTNRQASSPRHRHLALLCASLVLGLGIWAMHFIGMLAMELHPAVSYNPQWTALSILPGLAAAWLAMWSLQGPRPTNARLVASGCLVGLGIATMHYSGIAAMDLPGHLRFDGPLFLLSLLTGLVFSVAAFALYRRLRIQAPPTRGPWCCAPAALLTAAMASMHYLSMLSLRLEHAAVHPAAEPQLMPETLALIVAFVSLLVVVVLGLASTILRYRDLWQAVAIRDARLAAMINTASHGVITINAQGLVQDFNPAAQQIFGYSRDEVLGRNVSMLMPSPLAEQHDAHVQKHTNQPDKPIGAHSREVLGLRKDGRLIPIELTIGKAQTPSGTIFVGYLQDISERKRTDAQLRIAASVFQHVREGVAIVDANHNISEANPAFLRLMEQTRDSCIGKPLEALYEDADLPPDTGKLWKTVATAHYWQDEITLTRRDSSAWVLRLSISPVLNELQRPHHFIAVASDVTERPGLEAQLPHDALHDAATGLPNPQLFMARLGSQLQHSQRKSTFLGVAIVQLCPQASPATQPTAANHDAAMAWLAQWLPQQLRSPDTLARWQDHQLALALPGIQDPAAWLHMTQRLAQTLVEAQQLCQPYGIQSLQLGCSCTLVPVGTAVELVERACADLQPLPASPPPTPANAAQIKENP